VAGVQHPVPLMRTQTPVACSDSEAASGQHRMVLGRRQLPWLRGPAMSRAAIAPLTASNFGMQPPALRAAAAYRVLAVMPVR